MERARRDGEPRAAQPARTHRRLRRAAGEPRPAGRENRPVRGADPRRGAPPVRPRRRLPRHPAHGVGPADLPDGAGRGGPPPRPRPQPLRGRRRPVTPPGVGFRLEVEASGPLPAVAADRERVVQVLTSLLANAIRYSPAGGSSACGRRPRTNVVRISIRGGGPGLPDEALPHLFQKLYRVDRTEGRDIRGAGLGLAICKEIVEAHGGRIGAESPGPGRGSPFRFSLPPPARPPVAGAGPSLRPDDLPGAPPAPDPAPAARRVARETGTLSESGGRPTGDPRGRARARGSRPGRTWRRGAAARSAAGSGR